MTTNLIGLLVGLHLCVHACVRVRVRVPLKAGEAVGQRELLAFVVRLVMPLPDPPRSWRGK